MRVAAMVFGGLVGVGLLAGGCATYVNIPEQPGFWASSNPDRATVRKVEVAALAELLEARDEPTPYRVHLPEGASYQTYQWVLQRLPGQAMANDANAPATGPLYDVVGVFVRAREAQVDVVRPAATGGMQLVSVYLRYYLDGWHPYRVRPWQIPVSEAVRISAPGADIDDDGDEPELAPQPDQ